MTHEPTFDDRQRARAEASRREGVRLYAEATRVRQELERVERKAKRDSTVLVVALAVGVVVFAAGPASSMIAKTDPFLAAAVLLGAIGATLNACGCYVASLRGWRALAVGVALSVLGFGFVGCAGYELAVSDLAVAL